MIYRRFSVFLAIRLILIGGAIVASLWLLLQPGLHSGTIIAVAVVAMLSTELWWFISRTNRDVARFLDAARYADYSQRFSLDMA